MKFLIILMFIFEFSFACGCTDSSAATNFQDQATENYDSKDSELSSSVEDLNGILKEVKELVKSEAYLLNEINKSQQVYYDSIIFTLESRQQANAIIQKDITNWGKK